MENSCICDSRLFNLVVLIHITHKDGCLVHLKQKNNIKFENTFVTNLYKHIMYTLLIFLRDKERLYFNEVIQHL